MMQPPDEYGRQQQAISFFSREKIDVRRVLQERSFPTGVGYDSFSHSDYIASFRVRPKKWKIREGRKSKSFELDFKPKQRSLPVGFSFGRTMSRRKWPITVL